LITVVVFLLKAVKLMKISNCSGSLPGCRDTQVHRERE
jgi:hypothetical protein